MTEHRKSSRSHSRSHSKSYPRSRSRSAHSDKYKRSKSKDVYFENDDSSSGSQFTPSESSEEPRRHRRSSRIRPINTQTDKIPSHTKACCREEVKRLRRLTANYNPQSMHDTESQMDEAERELSAILRGEGVCRYHGKDGQRRKERDEARRRERNRNRMQKEKERYKHKQKTRPKKKKKPITKRRSHRYAKHEDTDSDSDDISDTNTAVTAARVDFRKDSKKVLSPFVDRKTTTSLFMLGKQYPWLAAFHRVAYMAFKQVGVPKPVSLMPKEEQARYKKFAKRRQSRR